MVIVLTEVCASFGNGSSFKKPKVDLSGLLRISFCFLSFASSA